MFKSNARETWLEYHSGAYKTGCRHQIESVSGLLCVEVKPVSGFMCVGLEVLFMRFPEPVPGLR